MATGTKKRVLNDADIRRSVRLAAETKKPQQTKDPETRGLYYRAYPTGKVAWYAKVPDPLNPGGSAKWVRLGEYPHELGIAKAREAHGKARVEVRAGNNPTDVLRAKRAQEAERKTAAAEQRDLDAKQTLRHLLTWYEAMSSRTWADTARATKRVFSTLLDKPFRELSYQLLNNTASDYYHNVSPSQANKSVAALRPALKKAAQNLTWVNREIAYSLDTPGPAPRRTENHLDTNHMPTLLPLWRDSAGHGHCMWFLAHCVLRLDEACELKWQDMDENLTTWVVPAHLLREVRKKKSAPPFINFPTQVVKLLQEIKANKPHPEYVFSLGEKRLPNGEKSSGKLGNWGRYGSRLKAKSGIAHKWHRHDIRHFSATFLGDLGIPPHVVEACQGRFMLAPDLALSGRYNKSSYNRERAEALQMLANSLEAMEMKERRTLDNSG
jgi:integrase